LRPGGQGVAGSNPAVPTVQCLISNTETGPSAADGSAPRSHRPNETAVARRVGDITPLAQGLPSPPKTSSPSPGRTCLRVKKVAGSDPAVKAGSGQHQPRPRSPSTCQPAHGRQGTIVRPLAASMNVGVLDDANVLYLNPRLRVFPGIVGSTVEG